MKHTDAFRSILKHFLVYSRGVPVVLPVNRPNLFDSPLAITDKLQRQQCSDNRLPEFFICKKVVSAPRTLNTREPDATYVEKRRGPLIKTPFVSL